MPPASKLSSEVSSLLYETKSPSLRNITSPNYGKPAENHNVLLESLGKLGDTYYLFNATK